MRILAVDPGKKHLGVAISDPTGTIANPLTVINHVSRSIDSAVIAQLASENAAELIIIGYSVNFEGKPTFEGRQAKRLAAAVRTQTGIPVELWDESFSTLEARNARILLGSPRHKRSGHLDELAATVILQSYLDAQQLKEE
jgi:putative Holliday junction resolvase